MTTAQMGSAPLRVLLVEDNPFHQRLVSSMALEAFGGRVTMDLVESLDAALSRLSSVDYDCLLLDLMLPDAVGLEGLHAVLDRSPGLPVVVVSAHDDEDTAVRCVEEGAQEYLVKGIADEQQLKLAILHSIERSGRSVARSSVSLESRRSGPYYGHMVLNPEGTVTGVDQGACAMLNADPDHLIGDRPPVHPDDRADLEAAIFDRAHSDDAALLRVRLLTAVGLEVPVDVQVATIHGVGGERSVIMQVAPAAPAASSSTASAPAEVGWRAAG